MDTVLLTLTGVFGAAAGSFLNVVIARLPKGESLVHPRSRCPGCGTQIAAYDNVPVLSWLLLRGRCRSCSEPISSRYPAVELTVALTFVAVGLVRGVNEDLLLSLPFVAILIALAGIDLDHRIVPNRVVAPASVYAVGVLALVDSGALTEHLAAGAAAFTFLLLAALAYPAGMGMGDVKLAGMMGLFVGWSIAPAMLVAFAAGSIVGIALMARQGSGARKSGVPFAPFLALGGIVAVLAGPELIDLYRSTFLS